MSKPDSDNANRREDISRVAATDGNNLHPQSRDVSIDALVDDLFGLNWRAIKTLGVSVVSPAKLARAAWSDDWENRYTPSFRLWFTLIAVLFFFQFFWAGDNSALIKFYAEQLESSGVELPEGVTTLDASRYFARINFAILPFASAFCLFALGMLYRAWGFDVPLVVRVRYVFAVVIPSTALSLPMFWVLGAASQTQFGLFITFSWFLPLPVDAYIAYRGVFAQFKGAGRLWRSLVLAVALFFAVMASAIISTYLAGGWINFQQGG